MKRVTVLVLAVLLALLTLPLGSAAAGPPVEVALEVETALDFSQPNLFTAAGRAVDEGLICPTGYVFDLDGRPTGWQSGNVVNFHVLKEFVCDDGSGSFRVKLEVHYVMFAPTNSFNWVIKGGTGDYAAVHGNGSGVGDYTVSDQFVLDAYSGRIH